MGHMGRRLWVACLAGLPFCGPAVHAQIVLEPPPQGYYRPDDRITFLVPADLPIERLQRIGLELNDIDVTAFVQREGERAVYLPPQPLAYGAHRLRLVEQAGDGAVMELATWTVQVRRSQAFREADANAELDFASQQRVADKNLDGGPPRNTRQGALQLESRVADDDWDLYAATGLLHNSQPGQMPRGQRTDLAFGVVEGARDRLAFRAGDQVIPASSLVLRNFARRGVSGRASFDALRSEFTAFAMRTEAVTGFRHGFGVGDSGNRTDGAMLGVSPLADRPERLHIAVVHLDGEGTSVGSGVVGDSEAIRSTASSLAVDSRLHDQRWHLRGELARSNSGFAQGLGPPGRESDSAHSLLALYSHPQRIARDAALRWSAGAEQSSVGPYYYSLGNPALAADRRLQRLFGDVHWGGWTVNAQLARETDNVDNDPTLPRLRSEFLTLGSNYAPEWTARDEGFMRLFNQPTLALVVQDMSQHHDRVPEAYAGNDVDQDTRVFHAGLRFVPGAWSWDIGHTRTRFRDEAGLQSDYDNDLTELGVDFMLGERYTLRPRIQSNRQRDRSLAVTNRTTTAGLGAWAALIPGSLDLSLDYSLHRERSSDDLVDTDSHAISGMLSWQLREARAQRPGIALFASGSYFGNTGATAFGGDTYQVFTGVRVGWPVAY
jgi:hypothetical protein